MAQPRVTIRLAKPDEGPLIGHLFQAFGGPDWPWLDWTEAWRYWLLGEVDGAVRGLVQYTPGVPFGRTDFLTIDPTLPHRTRAVLCKDLGYAALAACKQFGSQAVVSVVSMEDESWERVMTKRGWRPINYGTFLLKRI